MRQVKKEEGEEKKEETEQNQRKSQGDITFFLLVHLLVYKTYTEAEVTQALKVKKES